MRTILFTAAGILLGGCDMNAFWDGYYHLPSGTTAHGKSNNPAGYYSAPAPSYSGEPSS